MWALHFSLLIIAFILGGLFGGWNVENKYFNGFDTRVSSEGKDCYFKKRPRIDYCIYKGEDNEL